MADCNIRNIDDELLKKVKIAALEQGLTLKEYAVKALEIALHSKGKYYPTQSAKSIDPIEREAKSPEPKPCRHGLLYHSDCS